MRVSKCFPYSFLAISTYAAIGCCPPEDVSVIAASVDGKCIMDISYEGTALGVYVTEPDTKFPRSNSQFDGIMYFGLDTTTFPDGIIPPVRYGETDHPRSIDTKNGHMHCDKFPEKSPACDLYPVRLEAPEDCTHCELQNVDMKKTVGPFKVGVVSVPGNTETDPITDFECPQPGDGPHQYGTDIPVHRGVK